MKKILGKHTALQRIGALALALVMVLGSLPASTFAAGSAGSGVVGAFETKADPETIHRPEDVYGDNTVNAGKVTVGKSVSNRTVDLENNTSFTPGEGNFIVTISQTAQVLGMASEQAVPVDVVFVLDTSGSMDERDGDSYTRAQEMVTAANDAISKLMSSNPNNRIGVVAFSSSSGNRASAQVLSSLAHYTGTAATTHLQWVTSEGSTTGYNRNYIAGRNTSNGSLVRRQGTEGGTNIHAGIALGAQQLMNVTQTTATLSDGSSVTRMPFLIILSDGQPTYIANDANGSSWYDPAYSNNYGDGNEPYEGAGFVAALTAAYFKGKITEKYYGANASETNRCSIYTVGVELDSLTGNDQALAQITMDPDTYTTGTYAADGAVSYWHYGNSHLEDTKSADHGWKTYWNNFVVATAADFDVRVNEGSYDWVWVGQGEEGTGEPTEPNRNDYWVGSGRNRYFDQDAWEAARDQYESEYEAWREANYEYVYVPVVYTITDDSIAATKAYVTGNVGRGYTGGIAYNDDYFYTGGTTTLASAFDQVITSIQKKALSSPTHVKEEHGADFSGYVTFTDPIGEYMEVKNVFGIVADGHYYQGKSAAKYLSDWDNAPADFRESFLKVLKERCKVTGATMSDEDAVAFVKAAAASANQANYVEGGAFDNSIVWWGKSYAAAGQEDTQVQWLGFADDDSYEYITAEDTQIPTGADYVCRSYYFYGTAGGTIDDPNHEYLHFVVRVQRSLTAPYQETVVISAPASLLSVEEVFITEKTDSEGNVTYVTDVTPAAPARVIYEVGLRSDINAYNVAQIVGADAAYIGEATLDGTATNYSVDSDGVESFTFYTNDWHRDAEDDSHHRAMAHATFEAAADNSYYTYTEDTAVYYNSGTEDNPVYTLYTGDTAPVGDYYYAREYYDWDGINENSDGTFNAEKKVAYIHIELPATDRVSKKDDGYWYIAAGTYKASSLDTGEDPEKSSNETGTALYVVHPHRTTSETDNHYTVLLGNNGKLTLQSEKTKSVYKNGDTTVSADGKVVMIGDTLTYNIQVVNPENERTTADVVDTIPNGTKYVENSATYGGVYDEAAGTITWTDLALDANETKTLSFQVTVKEDLAGTTSINNTANVQLENGFTYTTNTTKNPPEGKWVYDSENNPLDADAEVEVTDVLVYHILWQNDTGAKATVKITDIIPAGTSYVDGSATHNGALVEKDGKKTLEWNLEAEAGASGVVSFSVNVNASAGADIKNSATITTNDPRVTNVPTVDVKQDALIISKTVDADEGSGAFDQTFTLNINEIGQGMNGTYKLYKNGQEVTAGITFTGGSATVDIKHGDTLRIEGIPVGAIFSVTEAAKNGFTPAYYVNGSTTVTSTEEGRVAVVETDDANNVATAKVEIKNTYAPLPAKVELSGKKVLETTATVKDTVFGFTAVACNASGAPLTGEQADLLTGEVTVSSTNKEASIAFSPLTFSEADNYYYLIDELDGTVTGIGYDKTLYLVHIQVTDNGSGQLQAATTLKVKAEGATDFTAVTGTSFTFTNTFAPTDTNLTLKGEKTLDGRTLKDGEFSFVVKEGTREVTTGTSKADGTIEFKPITYKSTDLGDADSKTFTYTVTEVNGGLTGVEYSTKYYTVVVTLTHQDGKLVANVTSVDSVAVSNNQYSLDFTNTFEPEGIKKVLTATKELTGRELKANEFNFVVKDAEGKSVATGMNAANGTITFSPIGYTIADLAGVEAVAGIKTKTYTYTVEEVIPDLGADPYMQYDRNSFEVTVELKYDEESGVLTATETYPTGGVKFTNIQHPDHVDVIPVATKTTLDSANSTDNVPDDATFSFKVVNAENGNEAAVGVGAANGNVSFSKLSFSTAGTYQYWIQEAHTGSHHGITYDATKYLMKVTVTKTNGKLEADEEYFALKDGGNADTVADYTESVTKPSFNNKYEAKGQIAVTAQKSYNRTLIGGEFAFRLVREGTTNEVTGVVDGSGNIQFANIYFDDQEFSDGQTTKIIKYMMSEVIPTSAKLPGVTYDTSSHPVYIKITHEENGTISAMVTDQNGNALTDGQGNALASNDSNVTFTNTYAVVEGTSVTFSAKKVLEGRTLKAGEFSFELYHKTSDGKTTLVDTATNAADGTVTFTRNYPAGVLNGATSVVTKYVIREVNNHLGGVSYATNDLEVTVTITDEGNGKLKAVADKTNAGEFKNTYKASGTTYAPEATKDLQNRDLVKDEFSFVVKETTGQKNTVSTGMNDDTGKVTFTSIGYSTAGTYIYTVSEVKGNLPGVKYDETVKYLKVTVTDDGQGKLEATGKFYSDAECTVETDAKFTNTYLPDNATVTLTADKKLTGRDMDKGEFSFVAKTVENGAVTNTVAATGGNAAADDGETAAVVFSSIGYSYTDLNGITAVNDIKTRVYIYELSEQKTSQGGVEFSTVKYYAKVTVTYNEATGELKAETKYYSDITCQTELTGAALFENKYEPTEATLNLPVDKTLINKAFSNLSQKEGEFEGEFNFELAVLNQDGTKGSVVQTVTNDANGVVTFDPIRFQKPGVYKYIVSESVNSTDPAVQKLYTLDDPFTVVVTVTDDLKGNLVATAAYYVNYDEGKTNTNLGGIDFINRYTAPPVTVDLTTAIDATKSLTGRPMKEGEFTFKVYDIQNNVVSTGANKDLDSDQKFDEIEFAEFTFNQAGEYHYWIVEDDTKEGVAKDQRVWEVHILVRYNESTGLLYVDDSDVQTYLNSRSTSGTASAPAFENVYTPTPTKATIKAQKLLEGRDVRNQEFLFQLKENGIVVGEAYNDVNGNISFEMTYTKADEHTYFISEVAGTDESIDYDEVSRVVTVSVTDDLKGNLTAVVSTDTNLPQFKNTYTPKAATVYVEATKIISGDKTFDGEQFSFELKNDADATDVQTKSNDVDGVVKFELTLDKAGTYTYTLREVAGTSERFTYDETTYKVTVNVTDDLHGQLIGEVIYDEGNANAPVFENIFTAEPIYVDLVGTKTLIGGDMEAGDFNFKIFDSQNNDLGEFSHDEDGNLQLPRIKLETAGTYILTVVEVAGTDQNMTYDDTAFQIEITVTNTDGVLSADVRYPDGGVAFVNTYRVPETTQPTQPSEPGSPDTGDHSNVLGYSTLAVLSLGLAMALVLMPKRRKFRG